MKLSTGKNEIEFEFEIETRFFEIFESSRKKRRDPQLEQDVKPRP